MPSYLLDSGPPNDCLFVELFLLMALGPPSDSPPSPCPNFHVSCNHKLLWVPWFTLSFPRNGHPVTVLVVPSLLTYHPSNWSLPPPLPLFLQPPHDGLSLVSQLASPRIFVFYWCCKFHSCFFPLAHPDPGTLSPSHFQFPFPVFPPAFPVFPNSMEAPLIRPRLFFHALQEQPTSPWPLPVPAGRSRLFFLR